MWQGLNNLLGNKDFMYMLANAGGALSQQGGNLVGQTLAKQGTDSIRAANYKDLIGGIVNGGGTFKMDGKGMSINMPHPAPQAPQASATVANGASSPPAQIPVSGKNQHPDPMQVFGSMGLLPGQQGGGEKKSDDDVIQGQIPPAAPPGITPISPLTAIIPESTNGMPQPIFTGQYDPRLIGQTLGGSGGSSFFR